jgi:hypothetical protein
VIAQERQGREGSGVRIGEGSLYDWVVEEIADAAAPEGDISEEEVEAAVALLAGLRRPGRFTAMAEAAFDDMAREMARRPRKRRRP